MCNFLSSRRIRVRKPTAFNKRNSLPLSHTMYTIPLKYRKSSLKPPPLWLTPSGPPSRKIRLGTNPGGIRNISRSSIRWTLKDHALAYRTRMERVACLSSMGATWATKESNWGTKGMRAKSFAEMKTVHASWSAMDLAETASNYRRWESRALSAASAVTAPISHSEPS